MNQQANLTPPTKTKAAPPPANGAAAAATPKEPKKAAAPKDPNAPKKPRAPRTDYGFSPDAVIGLNKEKAAKYRGQRLEWYNRISGFEGQAVKAFMAKFDDAKTPKGSDDPPRGWVRFFVQDGTVTLTKSAVPQEPAKAN